jgi:hypothetical protein
MEVPVGYALVLVNIEARKKAQKKYYNSNCEIIKKYNKDLQKEKYKNDEEYRNYKKQKNKERYLKNKANKMSEPVIVDFNMSPQDNTKSL